jgi:four helix bundle protein
MEADELKRRTKEFALQIIWLVESLPRSRSADVIGQQILRSATSIGANYRAACKARSKADFISKITVVEEEADESQYWLDLLADSGLARKDQLSNLMKESKELTAIFTASGKTAKGTR